MLLAKVDTVCIIMHTSAAKKIADFFIMFFFLLLILFFVLSFLSLGMKSGTLYPYF